jgi:PhnB protein
MKVVPDGYHTVTPWVISKGNTAALIDFVVEVFDATDLGRMEVDGVIGHAEVRIGDSVVMMFDKPQWPDTPAFLRLYVADDAEVLRRAVGRGASGAARPSSPSRPSSSGVTGSVASATRSETCGGSTNAWRSPRRRR